MSHHQLFSFGCALRSGLHTSSCRQLGRNVTAIRTCNTEFLNHQSQFKKDANFLFTFPKATFHTATLCCTSKVPELTSSVERPVSSLRKRYDNPVSQRLLSAKTTEGILSVLEEEAEAMDIITISVAVEELFDALKTENSLPIKTKHQFLTSVGMQKLCKVLRRSAPRMDPGDLINAVKLLSFLSPPGNHVTFQILLKLITKHVNLLDLKQITYLQFLIHKLSPLSRCALSEALEVALPVVFESQLSAQLDKTDAVAICDFLHYATQWKLSEKAVNFLVDAALGVIDRIPLRLAVSVARSMCAANFNSPSHEPLVTWSLRKVAESMESFQLAEIDLLMDKIAERYSRNRAPYYYNEDFVNMYCNIYANKEMDDKLKVLWSVKQMSIFRHVHIDLVDRVGEILAANPSFILNDDYLFRILVRSFSSCNYKPEKFSSFSSLLLEHPSLAVAKNYRFSEILLAIDLVALDLFPENLIRTLYSPDHLHLLEEFQERRHPSVQLLMLLYNAVKVLYPTYRGSLPPITMIENWKELCRASNANKQYPLKTALQTGLGGGSYVINGLYHDGLHIDHGIVMRKGGYPVAVNSQSDSQSDCLSSITKPPESIIVLIKAIPGELYANNTRRLRGSIMLKLKILENLGHPVVAIDLDKWMELPDFEKIPFLMQRIKEKMEHLQWNQNWGDVIPS